MMHKEFEALYDQLTNNYMISLLYYIKERFNYQVYSRLNLFTEPIEIH